MTRTAHAVLYLNIEAMENHGFIRTAAAVLNTKTAAAAYNAGIASRILISKAAGNGVSLLVFPELSVTGCSCGDLFNSSTILKEAEKQVAELVEFAGNSGITIVIGAPIELCGRLYNCAIVAKDGEIKGIVPKTFIPAKEAAWFESGSTLTGGAEITYAGHTCWISPNQIFQTGEALFAVEIGDDLWASVPPSSHHAAAGAHIIANPAACNETAMTDIRRNRLLGQHSAKAMCGYIYSSIGGDSTQDTVFAGSASIWETGEKLAAGERYAIQDDIVVADIDIEKIDNMRRKDTCFRNIATDGTTSSSYGMMYIRTYLGETYPTDFEARLYRHIEPHPFAPDDQTGYICREILDIQVAALAGRLGRIGSKAVIGISGGLDSTLALIVTALAFDRLQKATGDMAKWSHENIIGVTMPGFGTTSRTRNNAWDLMKALGITCREISIKAACEQHFKDISHDASVHDATYENTQARERTQILMDIANQTGAIVVGTGDLSELALGWATYNGDHMSMYGVNAGVPKTLVRGIVKWAAENKFEGLCKDTLMDILDTPISPELLPANEKDEIQQVTEDLVGPYELHDFFMYNFMKFGFTPEKIFFLARKAFLSYDDDTIKKWLKTFFRRFFNQQFKRSCMPDGPQVCDMSLSPRGGWHMASDAWSDDFTKSL